MRLTRVEAASMQEALFKIRTTIGENATIVGTRTLRRGGVFGLGGREVVEIYVAENSAAPAIGNARTSESGPEDALERARQFSGAEGENVSTSAEGPPAPGSSKETLSRVLGDLIRARTQNGGDSDAPAFEHPFLKEARELLTARDIERKLVDQLLWEMRNAQLPLGVVDPARVLSMVKSQVRKLFLPDVPSGLSTDGGQIQVLVGPTGVGKTTTIAKLAARAKINEQKRVGLVTLDTFRIAAVDQLQKYARIIGLTLEVVSDPVEFRSAIRGFRRDKTDLVLVDTAGRGHRDELKMGELREVLSVVPEAEIHLVLSATTERRTLAKAAERFVPLGAHRVILTKLDETESFGSLLRPLVDIGKAVSFLTDGQNVPDDIMPSDPDRLADLVLRVNAG